MANVGASRPLTGSVFQALGTMLRPSGMVAFFARRLAALLFTMLVVTFLVFTACELNPAKVARNILGPYATDNQVDILTKQLGLDQPFLYRYGQWLWHTLHGDFGYSNLYKLPVNQVIWDRLGNTAMLASIAFAIIVPLSVILGIAAGMREASKLDRTISILSIVTTSIPEFASGAFLSAVLVVWLGLLPGTSPLEGGDWSIASQFVLPVSVMVLYDLGYVVRMVRASMVETMTRPYIRTAVLKGLTRRDVILKHAVRNAMITPFTVILLQINYLVTGVVVVEAIVAYPGFGRMMLDATLFKDIPIVEAGAMFAVFISVMTSILGDFAYMLLNPKIRFQ
jgi:peptide/nickel transport system permease protein